MSCFELYLVCLWERNALGIKSSIYLVMVLEHAACDLVNIQHQRSPWRVMSLMTDSDKS